MSVSTMSVLALYNYDNTLFENLIIPNGVDQETLINNLLMECAELEILYSDCKFMKNAIRYWSNKQLETWNSLYETFKSEYNPIWNVDAHEELTRTVDSSNVGNDINKVVGFNSNTLETNNSVDTTNKGDMLENVINDRGGNIGVTTTQKMLTEELEIRPQLNIINYIIRDFKSRFCILVY